MKQINDYQTFCIHQILEKRWEYNGAVHQLFIDFKKAYNSARREVVYDALTEFGIQRKLVGLIKLCLNEIYNIGIVSIVSFSQCPETRRHFISTALEYAIKWVQENRKS
jgi:hypothetical protein